MKRMLMIALVSGLLGGFVGAAAYALVLDGNESQERGAIVRFGTGGFHDIENTPFCVELQRFCLVQLEDGELQALYAYDTHPWSRERNCLIRWLADFRFTDPATGEDSQGWFRADCSGTTYRYTGERVFGPGPRSMDRFPIEAKSSIEETPDGEITVEWLEVDTRELICGQAANPSVPPGCDKAPLPQ
jgi:hypothetical protein